MSDIKLQDVDMEDESDDGSTPLEVLIANVKKNRKERKKFSGCRLHRILEVKRLNGNENSSPSQAVIGNTKKHNIVQGKKLERSVSTPELSFKFNDYPASTTNSSVIKQLYLSEACVPNDKTSDAFSLNKLHSVNDLSHDSVSSCFKKHNSYCDLLLNSSSTNTSQNSGKNLPHHFNSYDKQHAGCSLTKENSYSRFSKSLRDYENSMENMKHHDDKISFASLCSYSNTPSSSTLTNCNMDSRFNTQKNSSSVFNSCSEVPHFPNKVIDFRHSYSGKDSFYKTVDSGFLSETNFLQSQDHNKQNAELPVHVKLDSIEEIQHQKSTKSDQLRSSNSNEDIDKTADNKTISSCISFSNNTLQRIIVNGKPYVKCNVLGKGGSSIVYEVIDEDCKVKAIKIIESREGDEIFSVYKNEIDILKRLQVSDRIIKLFDYEFAATSIKIVLEKGSLDLATVISNAKTKLKNKKPVEPFSLFAPFTVQHYWQEMLLTVQDIHKKGIVHSDLKPANFLFVNNHLKLIDFGVSSSIQTDCTSILKDSQAGTFNYMSPESVIDVHTGPIINGKCGEKPSIKISTKSDVWSLGCILYYLVFGMAPFQYIVRPFEKLAAITNPHTAINFPSCNEANVAGVIKQCLKFDPYMRPTIQELLKHPYLTGKQQNLQIDDALKMLNKMTPKSLAKVIQKIQE